MAGDVGEHLARIETEGWTVVDDAVEPELIDALRFDIDRLEAELGIGSNRSTPTTR